MSTKHFYRHKMIAVIEREIPYDPAKPETYQEALEVVAGQRRALQGEVGCTITHDDGKPVAVREKSLATTTTSRQAAE